MNMGGIELGSSDKHTQNHTYPRIARNPELRGIRGGSLCQLNPAYKKTLFSSYEMGGGMHCAVQTMFRPCSDSIWVQTQSSAAHLLLHLLTPMSFLKDSTDVRNMTHYRLILGRRGLSILFNKHASTKKKAQPNTDKPLTEEILRSHLLG